MLVFGKKKSSVHKPSYKPTQEFLRITEIRGDSLVMDDGTLRAVLGVSSTNFDLKNPEEQNALILGYQRFLNSLEYSVQILMQSRRLDVADYTTKLKGLVQRQTNELLRIQTSEYIEFINRLVETVNVMNKNFYVIVPLEFSVTPTPKGIFTRIFRNAAVINAQEKYASFEKERVNLDERVGSVSSNLSSIGLRVARLNNDQLIELLYNSYNFGTAPTIDAAQIPNEAITA